MKNKNKNWIQVSAGVTLSLMMVKPVYSLALDSNRLLPTTQQTSDKLAQWGLDGDLKLLNADLFSGFGLNGGYTYQVEPSYNEGLYTRYDKYYFKLDANEGQSKLSEAVDANFSVGLGLRNDYEVRFARQFNNSKDAISARPYFYKNLPLDAKRAIDGLKVGDYFSFKSKLGVVVSAGFLKGLGGNIMVDAGAHYLVSGSFQVHVLRLPDNKVRVKLVGLRSREKGLSAGIGFDSILDVFKVSYLDRRVTAILDLNPLKISTNNGLNNLFMVDYVVDLKDEETRNAYNDVMDVVKNGRQVKEAMRLAFPTSNIEKLKNLLVMDIEPLDSIGRRDVQNNVQSVRVSRSFKGAMDSNYQNSSMHLGIKLIRLDESKSYSENRIVSYGQDEEKKYYRLNSFNANSENGFFFNFLQVSKDVKMNAVLRTDERFENPHVEDLVVAVERKDKRFTSSDLEDVKQSFERTLPKALYSMIDFSNWKNEGVKKNNVSARYQIVLHPEVLDAIPEMDQKTLYGKYLEYLRGMEIMDLIPRSHSAANNENYNGEDYIEVKLGYEVQKIARQLAKTLDRKLDGVSRLNALMELRKNKLFLRTGIRFILEQLPNDLEKQKSLIRIDLAMDAKEGDRVNFEFGNQKESDIYKRLLSIQNLINNDGVDLRLESETLQLQLLSGQIK